MGHTSGQDAYFNGSTYRRDYKAVIALKRELAVIRPIRLAPKVDTSVSADFEAGRVLGQYTSGASSGLFADWSAGGASGLNLALCVLLSGVISQPLTDAAASAPGAPALFSGYVFKSALVGYTTAAAASGMAASEFTGADGVTIVKIR